MSRLAALSCAIALCLLAGGCTDGPASTSRSSLPLTEAPSFAAIPWGSGRGELGHVLRDEAASEGPMSLAADAEGRLFVLDQANERIQVFSPEGAVRSIYTGSSTAQDLAIGDDGRIYLLDRLVEKAVFVLDGDGRTLAKVPFVGNGVAEPAVVSGLFLFGDSVGVEVEHELVVRVADRAGKPDADRRAWDGRPPHDSGAWIRATLPAPAKGLVSLWDASQSGALTARRDVRFDLPVRSLRELAIDRSGRIFLGAHLVRENAQPPFDALEEREEVLALGRDGNLLARAAFAPTRGPEEQFRTFAVSPSGTVFHLQCVPEGVLIARWTP